MRSRDVRCRQSVVGTQNRCNCRRGFEGSTVGGSRQGSATCSHLHIKSTNQDGFSMKAACDDQRITFSARNTLTAGMTGALISTWGVVTTIMQWSFARRSFICCFCCNNGQGAVACYKGQDPSRNWPSSRKKILTRLLHENTERIQHAARKWTLWVHTSCM